VRPVGRVTRRLRAVLPLRLRLLAAGVITRGSNPVRARFAGLSVVCGDLTVLYMEHKDIFGHEIYRPARTGADLRVIDCGAHIGMTTMYLKHLAPTARITAIEPDPETAMLLRRNLAANGMDDVEVIEAALAVATGEVELSSDLDGSRVLDPGTGAGVGVRVAGVPLSSLIDGPVDFIKMNIEGAELAVLEEARSALHHVHQLIIEYHGFAREPQLLHTLLALLDDAGFRYAVHDFDHETNSTTKPPFVLTKATTFFLLVNAVRVG
jgi:FkbM family methyltransferase